MTNFAYVGSLFGAKCTNKGQVTSVGDNNGVQEPIIRNYRRITPTVLYMDTNRKLISVLIFIVNSKTDLIENLNVNR